MSRRFEGRAIVITGATGMAAATAERIAADGGSVFVVSRDPEECAALCRRLTDAGGVADSQVADLCQEQETEGAFAAALDRFGRIDGLFAVAGASGRRLGDGPLHEMSLEAWTGTFELNVTPTFLAAREAVRAMLSSEPLDTPDGPSSGSPGDRGSIVLMSSVLARHPSPRLFATHAYAAAKGAVLSLTATLAAYYAPHGLRVNAVAPSLVATPMAARAASDAVTVDYASRKQPLAGGLLQADDVASAATFLLSAEAGRITGQVLDVDGGWGVTDAEASR